MYKIKLLKYKLYCTLLYCDCCAKLHLMLSFCDNKNQMKESK